MSSNMLQSVAGIDAISRAAGNIGVPAAIALLILWQITPRLDQQTLAVQQLSTAVAVNTASCSRPSISNLSPSALELVLHGDLVVPQLAGLGGR